ncbi:hypothetical protein PENSPDRAFT_650521 [Peniophora sp. CONT]|nr:hypothetical protein PENSPDRAFT_650521 [Peniophora sp. CONT]
MGRGETGKGRDLDEVTVEYIIVPSSDRGLGVCPKSVRLSHTRNVLAVATISGISFAHARPQLRHHLLLFASPSSRPLCSRPRPAMPLLPAHRNSSITSPSEFAPPQHDIGVSDARAGHSNQKNDLATDVAIVPSGRDIRLSYPGPQRAGYSWSALPASHATAITVHRERLSMNI